MAKLHDMSSSSFSWIHEPANEPCGDAPVWRMQASNMTVKKPCAERNTYGPYSVLERAVPCRAVIKLV